MKIRRDLLKKALKSYQYAIFHETQDDNQVIRFEPSSNRCRYIDIETNNTHFIIPIKDVLKKKPNNVLQYAQTAKNA